MVFFFVFFFVSSCLRAFVAPARFYSLVRYTGAMAPLDGLRVIDLTRVVAGPFCTMMLGDMGAEVLKIEEPKHGDDSRAWAPFIKARAVSFSRSTAARRASGSI